MFRYTGNKISDERIGRFRYPYDREFEYLRIMIGFSTYSILQYLMYQGQHCFKLGSIILLLSPVPLYFGCGLTFLRNAAFFPQLRSSSHSQRLDTNRDMLSPLKPSAPSAPLLRFLHSQSGSVANLSTCALTKRASSHNTLVIGSSRRSSTWIRPDKSRCVATLNAKLSITSSRPKAGISSRALEQLIFTRPASTARRPFLKRLLDLRKSKTAEYKNTQNGPAWIDEGTDGMFNIGRGLAAKASNELRIRCTEFDSNGNVTLVNGEFRKLELIAKVRLQILPWYNVILLTFESSTAFFLETYAKLIPPLYPIYLSDLAPSSSTSCIYES